jgi:hypothetical protein
VSLVAAVAVRRDSRSLGVYPYTSFFLKVLLGAGFGKDCLQNASSKGVSGKIRHLKDLAACEFGSRHRYYRFPDRHGLDHDCAIQPQAQGWMSQW